ncbi:Uncharacterised protein [Salmonella enterica subsp. arizonae]|uniref:Uncharacterized protein n=1 Tax=Salmonella enterica subsp. arizonae TaxID=59203 RepID=A0A379T4C6_SALER|nr:Uncharacterised protein [Salmonella enterica subsp. arizonae]
MQWNKEAIIKSRVSGCGRCREKPDPADDVGL